MTEPIRLLFGSDFHFGVASINQAEMAQAFATTIFPLIEETDIFFINGDFFDGLVMFDNVGFDPIYDTILNIFALCEKHRTALRVLRGTFGHDRNQCKRFEAFYRNHQATFDFRYFDTIEIEEITVRDRTLRFFYVPDSLTHMRDSGDIVDVVRDRMREKGWDRVDYGCMHGFFDFTFPQNVKQGGDLVFSETQFPFLNKLINVGHVHQHRMVGNVVSNGSFDRLSHGDEDPKGCVRVEDYPDHYTAHFVENVGAAIYTTLVFSKDHDTNHMAKKTQAYIDGLKTDRKINLRFQVGTTDQYDAIKEWMRNHHPGITIARKKESDKGDGYAVVINSDIIRPVERKIAPTRVTIANAIRDHIPADYALSLDEIETYLEKA